ncbi:MAG: cytochrome c [Burkholderiaceae bacterium]|jgi:cytochrome c2|nr:cytochrome c [Burkholderiaceae bacterium]
MRTRRLALPLVAVLLLAACAEQFAPLSSSWQPVTLEDARTIPEADPRRGRALLAQHGCVTCHELPRQNAPRAHVGPPLTRFALRTNIGGTLPNQPEQLVRFLMNAPAELPGTGMPDLDVDLADARDLAAYLYTLK